MDATLPGQDVLKSLQDCVADVQLRLTQHEHVMRECDAEIANSLAEKQQVLAELAEHYLPDLSEDAIAATSHEVRDDLQAIAQRRLHALDQLQNELSAVEGQISELNEKLSQITSSLNNAVTRRQELEQRVAQSLENDESFRKLSSRILQLEQQLTMFETRVVESQREAEEKLPAYRKSRLFAYLHDRKFGTPDYQQRGMTRRLDRWVAKLIGYDRARRSYDFLTGVPVLMKIEVERRHATLTEAVQALEEMEMQHWRDAGLDEAIRQGEKLGKERDEISAQLEPLLQKRDALRDELAAAEDHHGTHYQQAIERLGQHLNALADGVLQRQAERTPDEQDDRLVAVIRGLRDVVDQSQNERLAAHQSAANDQRRIKGLQYVVGRFLQSEFESERSRFSPTLNMTQLFTTFLAGEINYIELWRELRRQQSFDPTWVEKATRNATDALNSDTGKTILSITADLASAALAMAVQNKLDNRGMVRKQSSDRGLPRMDGRFTKGDGF